MLENMSSSDDLRSNSESRMPMEKEGRRICVSDSVNIGTEPDSFVVDMEALSSLTQKDMNANSRITRNLTRKASLRGVEKKITERDGAMLISSPKDTLQGDSMPEKPGVVEMGTGDRFVVVPQVHHQITITNGCVNSAGIGSKFLGKRLGFQRSPRSWKFNARMIFLLFSTLSCIGSILIIYMTLSMGKVSEDDNLLLN